MNTTISELQREIVAWADSVFPDRAPDETFRKLVGEIEEMKRDPESEEEFADAIILLFDLAHLMKIDIARAVKTKMEINRNRKWVKGADGLHQHVNVNKQLDFFIP